MKSRLVPTFAISALVFASVAVQARPADGRGVKTPSDAAASAATEEALVPWSPPETVDGVVADESLGSGGTRIELKDLSADISVVTAEFLEQIGAESADSLLCYTGDSGSTADPAAAKGVAALAQPRMEVVFVLDTTGSMGEMIESAKRKIWAIANKLKSAQPTPEIRFGLVGYRDHGDEYVTRVHALGLDIDATYEQLTAFVAYGGGDTPEAVNEALTAALHEIEWSADPEVLRAIFLVGDAPPHMDYKRDVKWKDSCREAKQRGILINTLQCGSAGDTANVWRAIASAADGAYTAMLDQGRTTAIATDFDEDIVGINRALTETIVPYGDKAEQASAGRHSALLDAMSVEGVADRSSYLSRTETGAVISGRGDLLVELMSGRMAFGQIDPALLDPALGALPVGERDELIRRKMERRQELQESLAKLLAQREAAVAEQMEGAEDIVVLSPFSVLAEQAESKGYRFK